MLNSPTPLEALMAATACYRDTTVVNNRMNLLLSCVQLCLTSMVGFVLYCITYVPEERTTKQFIAKVTITTSWDEGPVNQPHVALG